MLTRLETPDSFVGVDHAILLPENRQQGINMSYMRVSKFLDIDICIVVASAQCSRRRTLHFGDYKIS